MITGGAAVGFVAATSQLRHPSPGAVRATFTPIANPAFLRLGLGRPEQEGVTVASRSFPTGVGVTASSQHGFTSSWGLGKLELRLAGAGDERWQSFSGGATRRTPFGTQTVLLAVPRSEEFLTVRERQGRRTWAWDLATGKGERLVRAGDAFTLVDALGRSAGMTLEAPRVLDASGHDVSPENLRWTLSSASGSTRLRLSFDDRKLVLPYVIDPAVNFARFATAVTSAGTSLTVPKPVGAVTGNLLLAFVSFHNNAAITAPAGWTVVGATTTNGAGVQLQSFQKTVAAADTTYAWTWAANADAVGTVIELSNQRTGVSPIDQVSTKTGTGGANLTTTAVTTGETNEVVVSFFVGTGTTAANSGSIITSVGGGHTQIFAAVRSNSVPASRLGMGAGYAQQAAAGASATPTAASDGADATRRWISRLVSVKTFDTTPPDTSITSGPAANSNSTGASFTFSGTDDALGSGVASFECKLDGGAYAACTSPKAYAGLGSGAHTFSVRALDKAGNTDASPASQTWTVDTTPPTVSIGSSPPNPSNSSAASIGFSSTDGTATFACKLDSGAFTACTSPKAYSSLADGSHTVTVRATDPAGNQTTTSATWTVDTTAPSVTITSSPADPSNSSSASVTFSGSESGSFSCQADGGGYAACTSPRTLTGLSDGLHTVLVKETDTAGNTGSPASVTWTIDTTAPTVSISSSPPNPSNSTSASIGFSGSDPGGTGVASFECKLDSGAYTTCTSPKAYASLSNGSHTVSVRATDNATNKGSPATATWTIDTTPPTVTIDSAPASPSASSTGIFGFSATEAATFACRTDGGGWTACTSPFLAGPLADGSHTVDVRATDTAGNTGSPASATWTIDTTAPPVAIDTAPTDPSNSSSASIGFSSADGTATFACRLDGGAFTACTSPKAYSGLGEGSHTLTVRATDPAGNQAATSTTWTIDTTAPSVTIDTAPADPSNSTSASVAFSSTDGAATFACKLDGGPFTACATPAAYSSLTDGSHTITVRATDPAGNQATTAASWTVDTAAPATTIDSGPSGSMSTTSATFTFSSSEPGTFECRFDGGGWAACTSPSTLTGLSEASHAFAVRSTDAASNTGPPASRTWTVDTTDPITTIGSGPADPTNATTTTVSFGASESATFECRLDSGSWTTCTSPAAYAGLAEGAHNIGVRATDAAGNVGPAATTTWTVDTTAPTTTVDSGPATPTNATSATLGFTAGETATFSCRLDGGAWATCSSPTTYSSLAEGTHAVETRATDTAGNVGAAVTTTWTVDLTAPTTSITAPPSSPTNASTASLAFTSDEAGASECRLDGGSWSACSSPFATGSLTEGSHTFGVRTTDAAGNTGGAAAATWTVDTTAPTATITGGPADPSSSTSATFTFTASEPGGFDCRLDAGSWTACSGPHLVGGLGDGSHTFDVRATDLAGNTSPVASTTWTVDTTAPGLTIDSGPSGVVSSASATVTFSSADSGATFLCTVDSGSPAACTSPLALSGLSEGSHSVTVSAVDGAGNASSPQTVTWTVDTTAPAAPTLGLTPSDPTSSSTATFTFGGEPGATFTCVVDGGAAAACTSPFSVSGLADGSHTFEVRAIDAAGNASPPATFGWMVDSTAPGLTITGAPPLNSGSAAATFVFVSGDPAAALTCRLDGGSFAPCSSPWTVTGLANGAHAVQVRATDATANQSEASYSWTVAVVPPPPPPPPAAIDTTPPVLVSTTPATGTGVESAALVRLVANEALSAATLTVDGTPVPVTIAGSAGTIATGPLAPGLHVVSGTILDLASNPASVTFSFTVTAASGTAVSTPPVTGDNGGGATRIEAADGSFAVEVPGTVGDTLVVTVKSFALSTLDAGASGGRQLSGLGSTGRAMSVEAYWLSTGNRVADLPQGFRLVIPARKGLFPVFRGPNGWVAVPRVGDDTLLPGRSVAYTRVAGVVYVLTRKIGVFALGRDIEAPLQPIRFQGARESNTLILTWGASRDNVGLYRFLVYVDGRAAYRLFPYLHSLHLRYTGPADQRRFRVTAIDDAGNVGALTDELVAVPPVRALTPVQARDRLAARKLRLGALTPQRNGLRKGLVIETARKGFARIGDRVPVLTSGGATYPGQN